MWWIFLAALLYLEAFSAGIALVNKSLGEKQWYLAFIPVYGLSFVNRAAGTFKVLTIPVKKCWAMVAELFCVILVCCAYWQWGILNVVPLGAERLGQIMILPVTICYLLLYWMVLSSAKKLYKRFGVKRVGLTVLLSLLLIPIPFILCKIKDRQPLSLAEMFQ